MPDGGKGTKEDSERRHKDEESRCNQDSCDAASMDQETVTHAILQDAGRRLNKLVLLEHHAGKQAEHERDVCAEGKVVVGCPLERCCVHLDDEKDELHDKCDEELEQLSVPHEGKCKEGGEEQLLSRLDELPPEIGCAVVGGQKVEGGRVPSKSLSHGS